MFVSHFSYTACKKSIPHLVRIAVDELLFGCICHTQLCHRYIYKNWFSIIRKKFIHSHFNHTNYCQYNAIEYCWTNQSKGNRIANFCCCCCCNNPNNIFGYFADTLYLVSNVNNSQLFLIWCLLFTVAQATRIRMVATAVLCMHHFLQLYGFDTHTIHHNHRDFPKKGATNRNQMHLIPHLWQLTKQLFHFRFDKYVLQLLRQACG